MTFNFDMKGASDAFEALINLIIPWRREYYEKTLKLKHAREQAEIQRVNAEILIANTKSQREERNAHLVDKGQAELASAQARKIEAEAMLIMAQAQKTLMEVKKEETQIRISLVELSLKIVNQYSPDLGEIEKMDAVHRMLPIIENLISIDINLKE